MRTAIPSSFENLDEAMLIILGMCTHSMHTEGLLVPTTQHKHTTRNINKCKQQMRLNPKRLRLVIRVGLGSSDKCCEVEKLGLDDQSPSP